MGSFKVLKLSRRERILIIILFCVVIIAFAVNIVLPQIYAYEKLQEQLSINNQKLITISRQKISEKAIQSEWEHYKKYFPSQIDDGSVLEVIGLLAAKHNLQLFSFSPGESLNKEYFHTISYDIVVTGDFSRIAGFIAELEQQKNLVEIKKMVIDSPSSDVLTKQDTKAAIFLIMYTL